MRKFWLLLLILYLGGYGAFRQTHLEIYEKVFDDGMKDKEAYVMFPENGGGKALYYLWRPLSYVDECVTGIGTHIGRHH